MFYLDVAEITPNTLYENPGASTNIHTGSENRLSPLNAELNPICHLLALLEAHHILHVSRVSVNGKHIFPLQGVLH